jgi:hypothetical protein
MLSSSLSLFCSLFLFLSFSCASDTPIGCISVTVYRNGESADGLPTALCPSHFPLSETLLAHWSQELSLPSAADRVILGNGERLLSWSQVSHELGVESVDPTSPTRRLYAIPPGLHFIWPFVRYGYTISTAVTPEDSSSSFLSGLTSGGSKPVVELESLSDRPRIFRLHSFFSEGESQALIANVQSISDDELRLQRSSVGVNKKNRKREYSSVRTSKNAFDSTSPVAVALMRRSFDVLKMPYAEDQADGLQIVTYEPGEAYISHVGTSSERCPFCILLTFLLRFLQIGWTTEVTRLSTLMDRMADRTDSQRSSCI